MFDPASLKPYEVIQVFYQYQGQRGDFKYFVVVCHEEHAGKKYVLCMKATSRTEKYENDKHQMAGCVYYKKGEVGCFAENTAIQPDNVHPIDYDRLVEEEKRGRFRRHGSLPADFRAKLIAAVKASITIPARRKEQILARL